MSTLLTRRRTVIVQLTPAQFLRWHPGCWVQYLDDTPANDASKALSTGEFDPGLTRRKQRQQCTVGFSLQSFHLSLSRARLVSFRNLGVDVDLVPGPERHQLTPPQVDARKDAYLVRLLTFPLRPHWIIETRFGLQMVFRVLPVREPADLAAAEAINRRLGSALGGTEPAAFLTQAMRVPGTWQCDDPASPFLCRLLLNRAPTIWPYHLSRVQSVLDAWDWLPDADGPGFPHPGGLNPYFDGPDIQIPGAERQLWLPLGLNRRPWRTGWWERVRCTCARAARRVGGPRRRAVGGLTAGMRDRDTTKASITMSPLTSGKRDATTPTASSSRDRR